MYRPRREFHEVAVTLDDDLHRNKHLSPIMDVLSPFVVGIGPYGRWLNAAVEAQATDRLQRQHHLHTVFGIGKTFR